MAESDGVTYFIPGLPLWVTENDLGQSFEKYGHVVKAEVVMDKGNSKKRMGYVTMGDADSRDKICTDTHEYGEVTVRALLTKDALHAADVKKVHLSNLATHISQDAIRDAFSQFGAVLDVHTPKKLSSGERLNYGFVTFGSDESFDAAIEAGGITIDDVFVEIKPSAQSKGEEVYRKGGKGKGKDKDAGGSKGGHGGGGRHEDPDAGIIRDRKGGFKYFVPGLPESVKDEDLRVHFSKYGPIVDAAVVTEKGSDVSRGFGYVTMGDSESRDSLLNDKHILGGKEISILLTKDSLAGSVKKIHLGNLREDISAEAIREAFAEFGQILDVHTPKDMKTGKRQNFGFVTFGADKAFNDALRAGSVMVGDCRVKVKPAAQSTGDDWGGKGGKGMDPYGGKGKGYDPYAGMDPYGAKGYGKGYEPAWDKGCGKGWGPMPGPYDAWGADPWAAKGYGKDPWGGDPYAGKGYAQDPYGGKGGYGMDMGKGGYGKDMWGPACGGDPWMHGGKGGPAMGPYGDPWAGKGGAPEWGGKAGGEAAWGGKGGGYGGAPEWGGRGAPEWGGRGGEMKGDYGKGGGKHDEMRGGKGDYGKGKGGFGKSNGFPSPY